MSSTVVCLDEIKESARHHLPKAAFDFINSGANDEITQKDNIKAFNRWRLLPRVLRPVASRDLHTTVLGHQIDLPVAVAPTALSKIVHPGGELCVCAAAESMNTIYTISSNSTFTMEELTTHSPQCIKFLQIYFPSGNSRQVVADMVRRAELCGITALVLTVDAPVGATRYHMMRNNFSLPPHVIPENLNQSYINIGEPPIGDNEYIRTVPVPGTWEDFDWLKTITKLPIILKGIMTAADAQLGAERGAAGVWVSNHGGRQLDTVPATIDVLPGIVSAVQGRCEVYLDSGVRRGTDILKALALGATAVFLGSPLLNGLAHDGESGAKLVLEMLYNDLSVAMALAGCSSVSDITRDLVIHETQLFAKL